MSDNQNREVEEGLRERINGLVSKALGSAGKNKTLSLKEIEEIALAVQAKVGQAVAQALVSQQGSVEVPGPLCEKCRQEMHYKGLKKRRIVSRSGEVEWERAYYYCEGCRRGFFPPG
jgi:hypothetical protein